jgi:hypothetical protein
LKYGFIKALFSRTKHKDSKDLQGSIKIFIVEIKAVEALNDVHLVQILTYLRLSKC